MTCKPKVLLLTLLFGVTALSVYATDLKGRIINESSKAGIPNTAIALINSQGKVVSFATADHNGDFVIKNLNAGEYTIDIAAFGYEKHKQKAVVADKSIDIGDVALTEGIKIDEVVVNVPVTAKADRLVYTINESDKDKSITDILDAKMPFVSINKTTGKISVVGTDDDFTILVNGKKSVLLGDDNQYVAELLKGQNIKDIELITTPDGKYIDKAAVLNFNTASSLPDGIAVKTSVSVNSNKSYGASVGITSKIKKFIYSLNYNYSGKFAPTYIGGSYTKGENYTNDTERLINSNTTSSSDGSFHFGTFSASYDLTKRDMLTANVQIICDNGDKTKYTHEYYDDISGQRSKEYQSTMNTISDNLQLTAYLDYQRTFEKRGRLLTASYGFKSGKNDYDYNNLIDGVVAVDDSHTANNSITHSPEHTIAVDFSEPINNKHSFYITALYTHRSNSATAKQEDILNSPGIFNITDDIAYTSDIAILKGNYTIRTKNISLTANVGVENTTDNIDYKSTESKLRRNDFVFPIQVFLNYRISTRSSVSLRFFQSASRPGINYINPYREVISEYFVREGNPNLKNVQSYSAGGGYSYFASNKFNLSLNVFCQYSNNSIEAVDKVEQGGVIVRTWENLSESYMFKPSIDVRYSPLSWLQLSTNISASGRRQKLTDNEMNTYWEPTLTFGTDITLWKGGNLGARVTYSSVPTRFSLGGTISNSVPTNRAQTKTVHPYVESELSFSQRLGNHFVAGISCSYPYGKYQYKITEIETSEFYRYTKNKSIGRKLSFYVSYKFGRFNQRIKQGQRAIRMNDAVN